MADHILKVGHLGAKRRQHLQSCMTLVRHTGDECLEDRREQHLNSAGRHMAEEGEIAQDVKGHGRAPHRALARQLPLPAIYRPAVTTPLRPTLPSVAVSGCIALTPHSITTPLRPPLPSVAASVCMPSRPTLMACNACHHSHHLHFL